MNTKQFLAAIESACARDRDKLARQIINLKDTIMADLSKLTASVAALQAQAAANTKAIADLVALAQSSGADQSAIDAITAQVDAVNTQLATDDALDPTGAPAPGASPAGGGGPGEESASV